MPKVPRYGSWDPPGGFDPNSGNTYKSRKGKRFVVQSNSRWKTVNRVGKSGFPEAMPPEKSYHPGAHWFKKMSELEKQKARRARSKKAHWDSIKWHPSEGEKARRKAAGRAYAQGKKPSKRIPVKNKAPGKTKIPVKTKPVEPGIKKMPLKGKPPTPKPIGNWSGPSPTPEKKPYRPGTQKRDPRFDDQLRRKTKKAFKSKYAKTGSKVAGRAAGLAGTAAILGAEGVYNARKRRAAYNELAKTSQSKRYKAKQKAHKKGNAAGFALGKAPKVFKSRWDRPDKTAQAYHKKRKKVYKKYGF